MPLPSSVKRALASPSFKGACTTILILLIESRKCAAQFGMPSTPAERAQQQVAEQLVAQQHMISAVALPLTAGLLIGAFFTPKLAPFRKVVWFLALFVVAFMTSGGAVGYVAWFIFGALIGYTALKALMNVVKPRVKPTTFGSAEWATGEDIGRMKHEKLLGNNGLFLGVFREGQAQFPLYYTGNRHLLTVAPTRAGKGTTAIIPNLLTYDGSVLVIDPKGENAQITAARRGAGDAGRKIAGMGQKVYVVDPWGITGEPVACFNPLDWLDVYDPDIEENAMMLADSLVIARTGGSSEFFDAESKALLNGILLYVATEPAEQETRTLGRVRDIIVMGKADQDAIFERMVESTIPTVVSTAERHASKAPELASNVLASLQSHTHFLDGPRMRESLSRSDFRFEDMKHTPMTVYLVLPADRLKPFGRWLRLLVQQALTMNARNIERTPAMPILFLLDEMAALGRLEAVEQAYGLMAGFGMQLWGIVQDVSQLERIYEKGWETFVSNSGVLQYLGSRDEKTAAYFSKLCGTMTIEKRSLGHSFSQTFGGQSASNNEGNSFTDDHIARSLALPDELMVLRKEQVLLLIENCNPIKGRRVNWFDDPLLRTLGVNLREEQRTAGPRVAPPVGGPAKAAVA